MIDTLTLTSQLQQETAFLAFAKASQEAKDSPAHRALVAACRERLDALLDLYLLVRPTH